MGNICGRNDSQKRGGGSAILVRHGIVTRAVDVEKFYHDSLFEVTAILLPTVDVVVATLYRTPDSNVNLFLNVLESFLLHLSTKYVGLKYIISADFNINILSRSQERESFLNLLRSFDIYWLNEEPTRGEKCIDNIVTNFDRKKVDCCVIEPHLSDHSGVYVQFQEVYGQNLNPNNILTKKVRDLTLGAILNFKNRLLKINRLEISSFRDVNLAFDHFNLYLTNSFNECCRIKDVKVNTSKRPKINWFSSELNSFKVYVMIFYDRFKNSKGTENEMLFKKEYLDIKRRYKNKINYCKKMANEQYISNSSNKCKAAWNLIKTEAGCKVNKQDILMDSNTYNNYFVDAVSNLSVSNGNNGSISSAIELVNKFVSDRKRNFEVFKWQKLSCKDILKSIASLSSSCSEDIYGMSNKVLKEIIDVILVPLTSIFNMILETGVYPQALKKAKVIPVYKKGDKLNPSSYRPISLVPIISKVFELCIKNQLNSFFISNNLFCDEQFGFTTGKNTVKAVENIVNKVLINFENKLLSSAVLIDLTKAFDCMNHELIIEKLFSYGIRGKELKLLISYLSDREQMVIQGEDKSDFKNVKMGVPQGSVLGPLLFIIAVNDFAFNVPCTSTLYADDTTLLNSGKNLEELINIERQSLETALEWFRLNFLTVNDQKTEQITFSLNHDIYKDIQPVKLLGIHLDSRLSWEGHVEHMCKKFSRVIYLLRKLRNCVTGNMLVTAYYSFFHSHLRYGIMLWGNSCSAQIAFKWQKKAIRVIKNLSERESCIPYFKELKIMTLPNLYIFCCIMDVKESLSKYSVRNETHSYSTRNNYLLDLASVRLEKTKNSHLYTKIKLFNKLPEIVWYEPLKKFENLIKTYLKENVFYSVDEYMACDTSTLRI